MEPICVFCGKAAYDVPSIDGLTWHLKCRNMSIVITAAKRWFAAEGELRQHSHAHDDHGGDWQYVPEKLATNKQQAEGDLFEAVRRLQQEG